MSFYPHQVIEVSVPEAAIEVQLQPPHGRSTTLPTFVKANGYRYVRFSGTEVGKYRLSAAETPFEQDFSLVKYPGRNPLYIHGSVHMSAGNKFLEFHDGTPFLWLADTWWFGLTDRTPWPKTFQKLVKDRKSKGFSVVQIVVGVPPEVPITSPQAQSQGHLPLTAELAPNPAYFDAVDARIAYLVNQGLVPCIFGGWGPQIQVLGVDKFKAWWREIIARYAAYPVLFCATGEVDLLNLTTSETPSPISTQAIQKSTKFLPNSLLQPLREIKHRWLVAPKHEARQTDQIHQWGSVAQEIHDADPYHRPLTIHPHTARSAAQLYPAAKWLDINTIQSGHSLDRAEYLVSQPLNHAQDQAFINLEPWYESIFKGSTDYWQRYAFWLSILAGSKGFTYGSDGLWNMRRKGDDFLSHWGSTPWSEAYQKPGSTQLGIAKKWLSALPWHQLFPKPDSITPHWCATELDQPLTAELDLETYLAYFPNLSKGQEYTWTKPGKWHGKWFAPQTMDKLFTFSLDTAADSVLTLPATGKDGLLLMSITR